MGSTNQYKGISHRAAATFVHPDYPSPSRHLHDIALIKLVDRVTMSDKINTACLNDKEIIGDEGYDCDVSGFGRTNGAGE